jgi:hypothetical protein
MNKLLDSAFRNEQGNFQTPQGYYAILVFHSFVGVH